MKGIVFTEFMDMVESTFGLELADRMIEETNPPSGGVYTAVGTYDFKELVAMVVYLSEQTGTPVHDLINAFGKYLFSPFMRVYPSFFERCTHGFDFLESIENHIHVEVKKLYPDAELPRFNTERPDPQTLLMIYSSERRMSALAEGLIQRTMEHYNHEYTMKLIEDEDPNIVRFQITIK